MKIFEDIKNNSNFTSIFKVIITGCFGYIIGKGIVNAKYEYIIIPIISLIVFIPLIILFLICYFLVQFAPLPILKIFSAGPVDIYIWDVFLIVITVKLLMKAYLNKKELYSTPVNANIVVFFLWGLICTLYGYYRFGEEHFVFTFVSYLRTISLVSLFFFASNVINSKKDIEIFVKAVLLILMFQSLLGIVQRSGSVFGFNILFTIFSPNKGALEGIDFRSVGTMGNPNNYGQTLVLFSFAVIVNLLKTKNNVKSILLVLFVFVGIILSGSKSAYLASLVLVFTVIYQKSKDRFKNIVIFISLLIAVVYFFQNYVSHRIFSEFTVFDVDNNTIDIMQTSSTMRRSDIWITKLKLLYESPIFGLGWFGDLKVHSGEQYGFGTYSHNQYIGTLVNVGVPGLFLFIILHYRILYLAWNLRNITNDIFMKNISIACFSALLAFYVTMIFNSPLETGTTPSAIFWAMAGFVMSLNRIAKREKLENDKLLLEGKDEKYKYST